MTLLFDYQINFLTNSDNSTKLPFSVFGMTQQGVSHQNYSIGNQDAACIYVGKNLIVGAVADGCSSGMNLNGMSSNQVGANIISYLAVRIARRLVLKKQIALKNILVPFQQALFNDLRRTLDSLNPWKYEREQILKNFLSSTIMICIVTKNNFVVLSCGDGNMFVNSEKIELIGSGGKYFANNLFDLRPNSDRGYIMNPAYQMNCLSRGETSDLKNILIATDGFVDDDLEGDKSFKNFFFNQDTQKVKRGFVDRKIDFRSNLVEPVIQLKNGRIWPLDDATFISIRRINQINN